jgi:hypothetical protein
VHLGTYWITAISFSGINKFEENWRIRMKDGDNIGVVTI